jgi:fructokinase
MNKKQPITLLGEVLFDQLPNNLSILGGAPFNVAWHLHAFGQQPQFISRVGNDVNGQLVRQTMHNWGMSTDLIQCDSVHPTGVVQVIIEDNEPQYFIVPEQAYDYIEMPTAIPKCDFFYHGSLAARSPTTKATLLAVKKLHQGKIFVDINLRSPWWGTAEVFDLIKDADWLKLNLEEFKLLFGSLTTIQSDLVTILSHFHLEGIVVTLGEQGALAVGSDGDFFTITPSSDNNPVIDTVGAGDAFSAVLIHGLIRHWDFAITLQRAQEFASAITQQHGAIVNDMAFYQNFKRIWKA